MFKRKGEKVAEGNKMSFIDCIIEISMTFRTALLFVRL